MHVRWSHISISSVVPLDSQLIFFALTSDVPLMLPPPPIPSHCCFLALLLWRAHPLSFQLRTRFQSVVALLAHIFVCCFEQLRAELRPCCFCLLHPLSLPRSRPRVLTRSRPLCICSHALSRILSLSCTHGLSLALPLPLLRLLVFSPFRSRPPPPSPLTSPSFVEFGCMSFEFTLDFSAWPLHAHMLSNALPCG